MADSELRYTFSCPSCAGSFSIQVDRIPPVRARFSCPKCGKSMDFPSRDEARVYLMLQPEEGSGSGASSVAPDPLSPPPETPAAAPSAPEPAVAKTPPPPAPVEQDAEKRYTVDKTGFEGDSFDRRAMRILIRSGALNEGDSIRLGDSAAVRADQLLDLKSLFELRKTARFTPPAVCRKHIDKLAHYVCAGSGRPLCEDCAAERKYGGTTVRVCDHCGGNVQELPIEHE